MDYNFSYELLRPTSHIDGGQLLPQLLPDLKYLLWLYEEPPLVDVSISNGFIFSVTSTCCDLSIFPFLLGSRFP